MALQYNLDSAVSVSTFKGSTFYQLNKDCLFLNDLEIVEGILCQGKKIRQQLKTIQPGQFLKIGEAMVKNGIPLQIQRQVVQMLI